MATFANILYDEAFKVVLTEPSNRQLLIKLIEFFVPEKTISALTLNDKEQHGLIMSDKNVNFDLYCTTDQGESFIVEMQFSSQESFRDRALYYATYPIRSQVVERLKAIRDLDQKGTRRMDYSLSPVYVISILNFKMNHEDESTLEGEMLSRYEIRSRASGEKMTDALHFIFLELGRLPWKRDEEEKCVSLLEKLAFSLKYGHLLKERPENFQEEVLRMIFEATAFANMNEETLRKYNAVMTTELDIIARREYARKEGLEEGMAEGRAKGLAEGRAEGRAEGLKEGLEKKAEAIREIARNLVSKGMPLKEIAEVTGLSQEELERLG